MRKFLIIILCVLALAGISEEKERNGNKSRRINTLGYISRPNNIIPVAGKGRKDFSENTTGERKFKARISFCNWNDRKQCPNEKTASGRKPKKGYVAVSPDIIKKYKLRFGQPLYVKGIGRLEYQCKTGNFFTKKNGTRLPIKRTLDVYTDKNVWKCYQSEVTIIERD